MSDYCLEHCATAQGEAAEAARLKALASDRMLEAHERRSLPTTEEGLRRVTWGIPSSFLTSDGTEIPLTSPAALDKARNIANYAQARSLEHRASEAEVALRTRLASCGINSAFSH